MESTLLVLPALSFRWLLERARPGQPNFTRVQRIRIGWPRFLESQPDRRLWLFFFIAEPLFLLLDWLYGVSSNWGLAIILLTLIVKLALYPLSAAGYKSMANMRRVAPQMKRIQERYANDREKLQREMMALYKKEALTLSVAVFLCCYQCQFFYLSILCY